MNWGANRWGFKPELGYSERWGHWVVDGYAGVWLYTENSASYDGPVTKPQSEAPVGSLEGHLSYDLRQRLWMSLDGNFWYGGVTSLSGIQNLATNRLGHALEPRRHSLSANTNPSKSAIAMAHTFVLAETTRTFPWRGNIPGWVGRNDRERLREAGLNTSEVCRGGVAKLVLVWSKRAGRPKYGSLVVAGAPSI